jgi:hypothetical protein
MQKKEVKTMLNFLCMLTKYLLNQGVVLLQCF